MSTKVIGDREKRGLISYLSASLTLYSYYILSCKQIANPFSYGNYHKYNNYFCFYRENMWVKAYLHGTTLSHATNLRQAYDMT